MNFIKKHKSYILVILAMAGVGGVIAVSVFVYTNVSKQVYLYAWERPEDFSFLKEKSNTAVVFYAGDIVIKDKKVFTTIRRNQLTIPDRIKHFPLVRIDSFESPNVLMSNIETVSDFIVKICAGFEECQIDFEARTSEYEFYGALLNRVRDALPDRNISITALASWCSGDVLDDFSTKTAVPMLYRLGKDNKNIKNGFVGKWFLSNSKCSDSIALSVDELDFDPRGYMRGKSVYLFNPEPWTENLYKDTLSRLGL